MITEVSTETRVATESGIELLEEMVSIPSFSTQERELGQWLVARLRGMGFAASRDEAGNVVAFWGSGPREVMLLGHIDTVAGFIPVRREGNRLFGRGAVDAKGPLAAAITAVARQPAGAGCRFTVIGAVEEEGSSRGARHLVSRRPPDQLVILERSGWDAITLGYKGSLKLRYRLSQPLGHGAGPNESAGDRPPPVWGCPTLAYGPGDSKLDHTPDEAMDLDDFARGVDVLTSALSHLAR